MISSAHYSLPISKEFHLRLMVPALHDEQVTTGIHKNNNKTSGKDYIVNSFIKPLNQLRLASKINNIK
jgi:hypothetical protein